MVRRIQVTVVRGKGRAQLHEPRRAENRRFRMALPRNVDSLVPAVALSDGEKSPLQLIYPEAKSTSV